MMTITMGDLVDVTPTARAVGFIMPVSITKNLDDELKDCTGAPQRPGAAELVLNNTPGRENFPRMIFHHIAKEFITMYKCNFDCDASPFPGPEVEPGEVSITIEDKEWLKTVLDQIRSIPEELMPFSISYLMVNTPIDLIMISEDGQEMEYELVRVIFWPLPNGQISMELEAGLDDCEVMVFPPPMGEILEGEPCT